MFLNKLVLFQNVTKKVKNQFSRIQMLYSNENLLQFILGKIFNSIINALFSNQMIVGMH